MGRTFSYIWLLLLLICCWHCMARPKGYRRRVPDHSSHSHERSSHSSEYSSRSSEHSSSCEEDATCTDCRKNQDESDVDCGGEECPKCANNKICLVNCDCISNFCKDNRCAERSIVLTTETTTKTTATSTSVRTRSTAPVTTPTDPPTTTEISTTIETATAETLTTTETSETTPIPALTTTTEVVAIATEAPTTTEVPTTMETATEVPATIETATEVPATMQTATEVPTTMETASEVPATIETATEVPATMETATEVPVTMETTIEVPTTMETASEVPATIETATEVPVTMETATEVPATMETMTTEVTPTTEAPTTEAPTTEAPTTEAPTTEAPTTIVPRARAITTITEAPTTTEASTATVTKAQVTTATTAVPRTTTTKAPTTTTKAPRPMITTRLCDFECKNGGTCTGHNQCTCRTGFSGRTCEVQSVGLCLDNKIMNTKPLLLITFGNGARKYSQATPADFGFTTTYKQRLEPPIDDGMFGFVKSIYKHPGDAWHAGAMDHTEDQNGYMYMVNADFKPGEFYKRRVDHLCVGLRYEFSVYLANICREKHRCQINPNVLFEVRSAVGNELLARLESGDVPEHSKLTWNKYGISFIASQSSVNLLMISNARGGNGNDLVIDDIALRVCAHTGTGFCPRN